MRDEEREEEGRQRPRVVDKRISARGADIDPPPQAPAPPEQTPAPEGSTPDTAPPEPTPDAPASEAPSEPVDLGDPRVSQVWTPEQEAEARRIAQEIAETPSLDWVINTAVTLANVAATKIELGDPTDAGLAIDALAGMVNSLAGKLSDAEAPLRQTLAQLQMAYAERAMGGPPAPG